MPADFVAVQVDLGAAGAARNLYTLVSAIDTSAPKACCELILTAVTATNPVLVGDANISATRYGMKIQGQTTDLAEAERAVHLVHKLNTIHLKDINLWAITTANMKVNVCALAR